MVLQITCIKQIKTLCLSLLVDNALVNVYISSHAMVVLIKYLILEILVVIVPVVKLCLILCDPMGCRMLDFLVLHYLPEFVQIHVHCVTDTIQPSHPLMPTSPLTLNLYQHQGLFQWVSCLHHVTKVLEFQLQHSLSNEFSGLISFRID